jgi:hypothetical protein
MAERQALHLLVLPRTRHQDPRWQGAVLTHTAIIKSGSRTVAAGRMTLKSRLLERTVDASKLCVEISAETINNGNDRQRNAGCNQPVFDGSSARVILQETRDKVFHNEAPG